MIITVDIFTIPYQFVMLHRFFKLKKKQFSGCMQGKSMWVNEEYLYNSSANPIVVTGFLGVM
jgi:hypothetical protein